MGASATGGPCPCGASAPVPTLAQSEARARRWPASGGQWLRSRTRRRMAEKKPRGRTRKRERKNIPGGKAYIQSTFNNTVITLTDPNGNVISWASAGTAGFKGSRKSTPYAAQVAADNAARRAIDP